MRIAQPGGKYGGMKANYCCLPLHHNTGYSYEWQNDNYLNVLTTGVVTDHRG